MFEQFLDQEAHRASVLVAVGAPRYACDKPFTTTESDNGKELIIQKKSIVLRRLTGVLPPAIYTGLLDTIIFVCCCLGEDNRRIQVQTLPYLRQTNGKFLFGYGIYSIGRPYAEYMASA